MSETDYRPGAPALPAEDVADLLTAPSRPRVIDLRVPEDFAAGHLAGAENIPFAELEQRLHELDPAAPVLLY